MKLFIDTANLDEIREISSWGVLDGVTTNPTILSREKMDYRTLIDAILKLVDGPISVEAVNEKAEKIIEEARILSKISENIVVKIPITPEGLAATKVLSKEGVKINMTLVFSVNQSILAAKAGATYASPFLGRLDDIGSDGMTLLSDIVTVYQNYGFKTQIIAASIRSPQHVVDAALIGADVCTIPYKVFTQMVRHPLTDKGIERFLNDWKKVKK
ncbi:MAG: fructose-6-phosphate aldolase [Actinomycetia bacterium]|nr:fructose-6-phosphate aldolase [Actinomycetes bacterium]